MAKKPPKPRASTIHTASNITTTIRIDPELLNALDLWVVKLNEKITAPRWTRTDVIRVALTHAVERGSNGEAP